MIKLTTLNCRRSLLVAGLVCVPLVFGDNAPAEIEAKAVVSSSPAALSDSNGVARTIQQYGLTFVLARSVRSDGVDTEEYFLKGETDATWSQMITYQRISLPEPLGADQYVTWLKRHMEQVANGPRLRVVLDGKVASIFGVHYATAEGVDGQFGLALVTRADLRRPNVLHLIQFAVNPARLSVEEMELQVKRWQARFQSQAASISP